MCTLIELLKLLLLTNRLADPPRLFLGEPGDDFSGGYWIREPVPVGALGLLLARGLGGCHGD